MKALNFLLSWTRIPLLAFGVHAGAYYASWAVNGGFSGYSWVAMASMLFFMHETVTRSEAYPGRYLRLLRRSQVEKVTAGVLQVAVAFFVSFGIIVSLFV